MGAYGLPVRSRPGEANVASYERVDIAMYWVETERRRNAPLMTLGGFVYE